MVNRCFHGMGGTHPHFLPGDISTLCGRPHHLRWPDPIHLPLLLLPVPNPSTHQNCQRRSQPPIFFPNQPLAPSEQNPKLFVGLSQLTPAPLGWSWFANSDPRRAQQLSPALLPGCRYAPGPLPHTTGQAWWRSQSGLETTYGSQGSNKTTTKQSQYIQCTFPESRESDAFPTPMYCSIGSLEEAKTKMEQKSFRVESFSFKLTLFAVEKATG